jgi:Carboxypeptidase regulatory-like domain
MTPIKLSLMLLLAIAGSAHAQDVMHLPAQCSDQAPPWTGQAPRPPRLTVPPAGRATLVGTVRERTTNRPVAGGTIRVWSRSAADSPAHEAVVDSLGRFALKDLSPDSYKVRASSIGYRWQELSIKLKRNRVDTLEIELPYHRCWGY